VLAYIMWHEASQQQQLHIPLAVPVCRCTPADTESML